MANVMAVDLSAEDLMFDMLWERTAEPARPASLPAPFPKTRRAVSFSETSTMVITEGATNDEIKRRWLSKEEEAAIKRKFKQQVKAMKCKISSSSPAPQLDAEDLCECTGMEKFLSTDVHMNILRRRMHIRTILEAQYLQRKMGVCIEGGLSKLSERSSEWTVTRSRAIAANYNTSLFCT